MTSTEDNEPKDSGKVGASSIETSSGKHQGNDQMPEITAAALTVSLPSSHQKNGTAMISPPNPFTIDATSTMLAAASAGSESDHTLNEKGTGTGQNITQFSVCDNSVDALAFTKGDSGTKIAQANTLPMQESDGTIDQGASTTHQPGQIGVSMAFGQSSLIDTTIGYPQLMPGMKEATLDQSNVGISKAAIDDSPGSYSDDTGQNPQTEHQERSMEQISPQLHIDVSSNLIKNQTSTDEIFPEKDPAYERRGSGFLLLAAEAMERSESRENAIRRAAMELTAAAPDVDPKSIVTSKSCSFGHSSKLQEIFEVPILHADQLSSTSCTIDAVPQHQKQAITWPTESNLPTVTRIEPPRDSSSKYKLSQTSDRLPSGRLRPPPQKHVYHDYASVPHPTPNTEPASNSLPRKKTGGVSQPFPEKLMALLDQETSDHPDVISWLPHGRAFLVRKPKAFSSEIMPNYFRQSKLTSFQRQLNLYGFRRITQGSDGGAYYHELFLRGRPNLCSQMTRQKVKGTGHKQPTDVASEPNFYAMPSVLPLPATTRSQPMPEIAQYQEEENVLMNSPGIRAATLLRRLSSIGTPNQFSLDGITAPPLVSGTKEAYSFDSFKSDNSARANVGESTDGEQFEEV